MIHGPNSHFSGAFSIAKKLTSLKETTITPAPGTYNLRDPTQSKTCTFTKAKRKPLHQPILSPEVYDTKPQFPSPPNVKFSKAKDIIKAPFELGPGSYTLTLQKETPSYTFQSKPDPPENNIFITPGPGSYFKENHSNSPQQLKKPLNTKKQSSLHNSDTPGPGQYNPEIPKISHFTKFPKQIRNKIQKEEETPGPGAFLTTLPKTNGVSFGQKLQTKSQKQFVPGPGTYMLKSFVDTKQGTKIGTSQRSKMQLVQGPSPQDYTINQNQSKKNIVIGNANRSSFINYSQSPGPGQYYLGNTFQKSGTIFSKVSKESLINSEILPGPGKYNLSESQSRGPSFHIQGKYDKQNEPSLLGPGRYNIIRDITDGPKYKFSMMERTLNTTHQQTSIIESQQYYDIQQSIGYVPSYLIKQ